MKFLPDFRTSLPVFSAVLAVAAPFGSALSPHARAQEPVVQTVVARTSTDDASVIPTSLDDGTSSSSAASLPDAPSAVATTVNGDVLRVSTLPAFLEAPANRNVAPKYAKTIPADETAQTLTAGDKMVLGLRDLYAPVSLIGIATSAGYSHLVDGQPNYGTNSKAFAQRLGASAARGTSQGIFTDMVFSPLLHMDPRYYAAGPSRSFAHRTVYSITRVLISRTDSGRQTINAPLLLGYAGAAGLTNVYYPQVNRNFKDTATGYGGSLGGAALGFFVAEFIDSALQAVHLEKKP